MRISRSAGLLLVCVGLVHGVTSAAVNFQTYTITDLGVGMAVAVNDAGQVTGLSGVTNYQAFIYSGGIKTTFGPVFLHNYSRGWGINGAGVISGSHGNDPTGNDSDAFTWHNGTSATIPMDHGYDINDLSQVVGQRVNGQIVNAAIYHNGSVTDLGTLGGDASHANGVNNAGTAVGRARTASDLDLAAIWKNGGVSALHASSSEAHDINNSEQVVGSVDVGGSLHHAALWHNGTYTDIHSLFFDSIAYSINDWGTVVGYAGHAFIWSQGEMKYLNDLIPEDSGWTTLRTALDISNTGYIVGQGEIGGQSRAFLLTPVPEPASASVLLACLLLAGRRRRNIGVPVVGR